MSGDIYWSSVSTMLHLDGSFADSAAVPLTWTAGNSAAVSTAQKKFGTHSVLMIEASYSYLSTPFDASLSRESSDYTLEMFFYPTSWPGWAKMWKNGTGDLLRIEGARTVFAGVLFSHTAIPTGAWHHLAVSVESDVGKLFVDGVLMQTVSSFSASWVEQTSGTIYLGSDAGTSQGFNGYIDEVRVTKGIARYTADFTPPTEEFPGPVPASMTGAISLPSFSMTTYTGGSAAISLPAQGLSALGGVVAAIGLPALSGTAFGHDSTGEQALNTTLPKLSATANSGANTRATLPKLSASASGTVTILADAEISLPSLSTVSEATVSAMASAAISLPSFSSTSFSGAVCSITVGGLTTQATGVTGAIGRAQVTLPLFEATATATKENYGSAHITLPSLEMGSASRAALTLPSLELLAIGTATIAATYEAYAVNLNHKPRGNTEPVDETTRYTNFPFTHVVRYQNSYYGANSTGLYLLEGTTDAGTAIPWAVKTAMTDFDSPTHKTVASAYFGGRLGAADTITLHAGEGAQTQAYSYTTPRGALAQNYRQVFGKGIRKHRYYSLAASGSGEFEIDDIELDVVNMTRRI